MSDDLHRYVLDELIERVPATLMPVRRDACILATKIGYEVGRYFGLDLRPLPVHTVAWNAEALAWLQERGGDLTTPITEEEKDAFFARGAWTVVTDPEPHPNRYPGHLVLHDPAHGGILDLSLGQMTRAEKGIVFPDGCYLHGFELGGEGNVYTFGDAVLVVRTFKPAYDFRRAPDWKARNGLIGPLIRELRAAAPVPA